MKPVFFGMSMQCFINAALIASGDWFQICIGQQILAGVFVGIVALSSKD